MTLSGAARVAAKAKGDEDEGSLPRGRATPHPLPLSQRERGGVREKSNDQRMPSGDATAPHSFPP